MISQHRKSIYVAIILLLTVLVVSWVAQGFIGFKSSESETALPDSIYLNRPFKLPDTVYFAGERMPLENFDTRESLEREIITSAFRHSSTILIIKRSHRYLPVIEKILKENNIPDDFKYLVAAESEYSNVVSPAGATGFWQIMRETGREQGMEINDVVDERYDVEKSTRFACDYFRKSYEKYNSWTMAAASYNGGRAGIDEQINIQHQDNYYNLLLSEETARYVFRVVAYKLIISDPKSYGFNIASDELYPELDCYSVEVDTAVSDFSKFAEHFGTNYKLLKFLNPWLRKPYLKAGHNKVYNIRIPAEGMRNTSVSEED